MISRSKYSILCLLSLLSFQFPLLRGFLVESSTSSSTAWISESTTWMAITTTVRTFSRNYGRKKRMVVLSSSSSSSQTTKLDQNTTTSESNKDKKNKRVVSWMERARQLYEFKLKYGHTLVPKGYAQDPGLSVWVYKQRRLYKMANQYPISNEDNNQNQTSTTSTTLTPQRIRILNELDFCWDAAAPSRNGNQTVASSLNNSQIPEQQQSQHRKRKTWWDYYALLWEYCQNNKDDLFVLSRRIQPGIWLDQQRQLYRQDNNTLTHEQLNALTNLHPDWWMTSREYQWECRYRELCEYQRPSRPQKRRRQTKHKKVSHNSEKNSLNSTNTTNVMSQEMDSSNNETTTTNAQGTKLVARICAEENPGLARWVNRQRREYRQRCAGLPSPMTDERQEKLERIGFVWFPWGNISNA